MWPSSGRPIAELVELARVADEEHWHGIWFADHYMPFTGTAEAPLGDNHECWAFLGAVTAITQRVRIGSLVAPTSVHHPAVLANRAATLDHLSNGRFVLGLGAGWQVNEHEAYGIPLEAPGTRVGRFEEAIQIVRGLLADTRTTFHGTFYEITDAPCEPKPIQSPLPILVGTRGPRMLRIAARYANEWNSWGAPEMAIANLDELRAACAQLGREPGTMWTSAQALVHLTDDVATIASVRSGPMGPRSIAGSSGQLAAEVQRYADAGFDELIVPDFTLGATAAERLDTFRRLRAEVFSQVS